MVPVIASNGASFRGAFLYYCHDRGAETTERVSWSQTINMLTDSVAKAWKVMAYTAQHQNRLKEVSGQKATGAKLKKPVFAFSLSWAPEERPEQSVMLAAAKCCLEMLGLAEHQAIVVAHNDQTHRHVHIIANTVHPLTGLVAKLKHTKRKLSDFALQYERENGKIFCKRREENKRAREQGKPTRYSDSHLQEAWDRTRTGAAFRTYLEERGYRLAQGRKRIVVVDPYGKVHNPTRLLKNVRAADLQARLADLDLTRLPTVEALEKKPPKETQRAARQPVQPVADIPAPVAAVQDESAVRHALKVEGMMVRQREERRQLVADRGRVLDETKERLIAYYRLREQKKALIALNKKIKKARWWQKLVGSTKNDQRRFTESLQGYKNAVGRYWEQVGTVRRETQQALVMLERTHEREQNRVALAYLIQTEREQDRDDGRQVSENQKRRGRFRSKRPRNDLDFER
ncbi:MAG TPA: relaxase/mobilization nuclease domain-containing protein [Chthoniobacteraceae bacterium]|nr:relaxase/mobilization nuclease domain-containing protein [Chthoniobacteraceae bacterium]